MVVFPKRSILVVSEVSGRRLVCRVPCRGHGVHVHDHASLILTWSCEWTEAGIEWHDITHGHA